MSTRPPKSAELLRRRCRVTATLLLLLLLLITFSLWRASIDYMDIRLKPASDQNARQAIERFTTLLMNRLNVLRHVGHFYEIIPEAHEAQFQAFCGSVMAEVPGIRGILLTDTQGRPIWTAPQEALPLPVVYVLTANPRLGATLQHALETGQTAVSESMDIPQLGGGFLAATPVHIGNRHLGFVIGVFQYQELLTYLIPPELTMRYHVSIVHANRPIFPAPVGTRLSPYQGMGDATPSSYDQTANIPLGGQSWMISMDPLLSPAASPVNLVSLTILALGLGLSILLTRHAYRWQWRAIMFQFQARDSQQRLERTGLSLAEAKTEMDLILNSVDEGIIFYNEQLKPVQANAAFLLAFNLNEDDPAMRVGTTHHEHMIQAIGSETKYWSLFNTLRDNPDQSYTDELELRPRGNDKNTGKILLRRATCACRPDGTPRGVLVIYKDLTRIKMIDRVKDEFLSNVTHELRSPLASIKGFAETLRRDPAMATETRAEFTRIICDEAARLQNLIDELLDLRRMEAQGVSFNPVPYDLKAMVETIVKATRSMLLAKNLRVKIQWDGLFGSTLKGDVAQLNRALRNLLVNAIKYSPQGGEITITGHCGQYRVWLEVGDQGSGIDERDLPHIFDKFYRGARQGYQQGTGLGLAIVKNIIEMHGGHLGVRSEIGLGTTFRMDLPRTYPQLNANGPAPARASEIPAETPLEALREFEEKQSL